MESPFEFTWALPEFNDVLDSLELKNFRNSSRIAAV